MGRAEEIMKVLEPTKEEEGAITVNPATATIEPEEPASESHDSKIQPGPKPGAVSRPQRIYD